MRTPSTASPAVVLTTLNAKYIHASLGLRYLLANLGELRESTALREFTIARPVGEIVDDLLSTLDELNAASGREGALQIVGFGVYIWNVVQTTAVVRTLRAAWPHVRIVLGGPEVSHETDGQEIVALADHFDPLTHTQNAGGTDKKGVEWLIQALDPQVVFKAV